MSTLTDYGQRVVNDLSYRYGLSQDAVIHMVQSVINGGGTMAQFNCPELGGSGQWMQGGMTMVGDMFNNGLKATVDNLCSEISGILANSQGYIFQQAASTGFSGNYSPSNWWPSDLGMPSSSGAQNSTRYAVFPHCQRLAVEMNGQVTVYDTLDHQIGGVGQQQGGGQSMTFTSQYGTVFLENLPVVTGGNASPGQFNDNQTSSQPAMASSVNVVTQTPQIADADGQDVFATIEKLADLKNRGYLSEDEFSQKKSELLARL